MGQELHETRGRGPTRPRPEAGFTQFLTKKYTLHSARESQTLNRLFMARWPWQWRILYSDLTRL